MITLRPYQTELLQKIRYAINHGHHRVCAVLGCGGGKSVIIASIARMTTDNHNRVLFLVHRKELVAQIKGTMAAFGVDPELCLAMMVQTATRRVQKIPPPALIIVDEAHHSLSNSYIHIMDVFPRAVVVGFTATPQRMGEGGLGKVFQELITSVSTKWLIEHHYLAPYKYLSVKLADTKGLHTRHGDYDQHEVAQLMEQGSIFGGTVEQWQKHAAGLKTIVYCASIKASEATAESFQEAGIKACHLDGETPKAVREKAVADFRSGKIQVLCNVDLFGEGFDVPDCETVVLLRPTKSLTLFIQQSMRPMRIDPKNPNKVAIILDHVGNYTRHGLPDDDREWSLKAKKKKEKSQIAVRQCPNCYRVFRTASVCPYCGYEFQHEERPERETVEGVDLEEVKRLPYGDYHKARNFTQLEIFRKAKGYKFGWSLHKAVELGITLPPKYQWAARKMGVRV